MSKKIVELPSIYDSREQADSFLRVAEADLKEVEDAYQPSGKVPLVAKIGYLIVTPILVILITVLTGGLSLVYRRLYWDIAQWMGVDPVRSDYGELLGWPNILILLAIAYILITIPPVSYNKISRLTRVRNRRWPPFLAWLTTFVPALVIFVPWLGDWPQDFITIAPTKISVFGIISLHWPLTIAGIIVLPLWSASVVSDEVDQWKFDEIGNTFLNSMITLFFPFAQVGDVLNATKSKDYDRLREIDTIRRSMPQIRLQFWWHDDAEMAYLDLWAVFYGKYHSGKRKESRKSSSITSEWLISSQVLERADAEEFAMIFREPIRRLMSPRLSEL